MKVTTDITPAFVAGRIKEECGSMTSLADEIGVDLSHLSYVVSGQRKSDRVLEAVANRIGIRYEKLRAVYRKIYRARLLAKADAA